MIASTEGAVAPSSGVSSDRPPPSLSIKSADDSSGDNVFFIIVGIAGTLVCCLILFGIVLFTLRNRGNDQATPNVQSMSEDQTSENSNEVVVYDNVNAAVSSGGSDESSGSNDEVVYAAFGEFDGGS